MPIAGVVFDLDGTLVDVAAGSAQLHALFEAEGIGRDPLFAPGSAILHCTLAVEVAAEDLQRGIEVCRRHPETLEGAVAGVELLEFFPVRSLYRRGLGAV